MSNVRDIADAAKRRTQEAIDKGNTLHKLELRWGQLVRERLPRAIVPPFTGQLVGEMKHMVAGYGRDTAVAIMELAVQRWTQLRRQRGKDWLPDEPTFHAVYLLRDELAGMVATQADLFEVAPEPLRPEPPPPAAPKPTPYVTASAPHPPPPPPPRREPVRTPVDWNETIGKVKHEGLRERFARYRDHGFGPKKEER